MEQRYEDLNPSLHHPVVLKAVVQKVLCVTSDVALPQIHICSRKCHRVKMQMDTKMSPYTGLHVKWHPISASYNAILGLISCHQEATPS